MSLQGIWRFIPHYREVEDYPESKVEFGGDIPEKASSDKGSRVSFNTQEVSDNEDKIPDRYELRDEADRPWWKFFDEYEYRWKSEDATKHSRFRWGPKNMPGAEKKLLIKLNLLITFYSFVGYWIKYLDQSNITNAYVSGMKQDINMKGNDLINANSLYNGGAVGFQVLFMYLLPRVPLHYLIAGSELIWGVVTLAHYAIVNPKQLYALRFLTGAAESGYFILWHYCFSNFFLPTELGFVGGFYYCGQMLGYLTSGLIAGQATATLEGHLGLEGWRWLFILDAIITIPVALIGFFIIPGTPYNCYSIFLTDDDIRLARLRLKRAGIQPPPKKVPPFFAKDLWLNILKDWRIYILLLLDYFFWSSSAASFGGFALWLKADKTYSTPTLNRLTAIPPALGILYILLVNIGSDVTKSRVFSITWAYTFNFLGLVILAIWAVPEPAKWFAFMLAYFGITVSSVIYGWMNDIMRHDAQQRAIVLLFTNLFSQQFRAWVDRFTFATVDAPRFQKGYIFCAVNTVLTIVMAYVTLFFYKRQERKDARANGIYVYNSKEEISPEIKQLLDVKKEKELEKPFVVEI